jgi:hypothetical protein
LYFVAFLAFISGSVYILGMEEKNLIQLWNDQRAARIKSQLAPTLLLSVVLALTTTGHLTKATDQTLKLFAIGLVVAGGVFSVTAMVGAVRDGAAVIASLKALKGLSPLGKTITKSADTLWMTGGLFVVLSLFNFIVLWIYLFR